MISRGCVADVLRGDDVGRAEEIGQTDLDEVVEPLGHAHSEGNALGAVLFLHLQQALGHRLQGLIPRDPFPLPFAAAADALHRVTKPVRVVELVRRGEPLDAGVALAEKARRVPLDLDDPVVLNPHQERAAPVVHARAVCLYPSDVFCHKNLSLRSSPACGEPPRTGAPYTICRRPAKPYLVPVPRAYEPPRKAGARDRGPGLSAEKRRKKEGAEDDVLQPLSRFPVPAVSRPCLAFPSRSFSGPSGRSGPQTARSGDPFRASRPAPR